MKEGVENIINGNNKTAIEKFSKVIALQPENYDAFFYRANANFNIRNAKDALSDYNKVIQLKPNYADAYYNRAICKQFMNDITGACNDWKKAISLGKRNIKDMFDICH